MKISQLALAVIALVTSTSAFAGGILDVTDGTKSLDNVKVSASANLKVEARDAIPLTTVGAGIRTATFGIHAYEAELLVNDKSTYICDATKALDSVATQKGLAIRINVLFGFGNSRLLEALNAGFESNGVDANNADVKKVLDAIAAGPDAPRGDVIVFAGEKLADGTEVLTYENAAKKDANGNPVSVSIHGASGLLRSIFSLWLGATDDSGLQNLDTNLTTCQI